MQMFFSFFCLMLKSLFSYDANLASSESEIVKREKLTLLISCDQIQKQIHEMAQEITSFYQNKPITIIAIMRGSIFFAADLLRELPADQVCLETIQCKSYYNNQRQQLTILGLEYLNLKDKDVLIIDDIFDSGKTISDVMEQVKSMGVASVRSMVLLYKKDSPKETSYVPDWSLFKIPSYFVIGYGLDYDHSFRGLKGIYYKTP